MATQTLNSLKSNISNISNISNKAPATAKSVLEKLKSISAKTAYRIDSPLDDSSDPMPSFDEPETTAQLIFRMFRYLLVFLVLSFIILNILASLGILPVFLADLFRPIFSFFGYNIGETIRQTSNVSDDGVKSLSGALSSTVNASTNFLEKASDLEPGSAISELHTAVNKKSKAKNQRRVNREKQPKPDEADSRTQHARSDKSEYCYIGEDRGFRSCIAVSNKNQCMSGDIFPTKAICINPNLRS